MKKLAAGLFLACWAIASMAASPKDVVQTFVKAGASDPALNARVTAIQQRVAIILVPGILGSKLTSPTIGPIWGTELLPDLNKLALPASLVDENATSDVEATLLESYYGDQYGKAFAAIKAAATTVGAKAVACGYDWRRDLRSGAADLEKCIKSSLGAEKHIIIFISHSMGGIVTSLWNAAYELEKYSPQHLVGGIALLGSPLAGSCELLRMIHEGYRQPQENTLNAGRRFEYLYESTDMLSGTPLNALSGWATDGVRTSLLSWPGAFELTPKATNVDTQGRSCVPLRRPGDEGGSSLISYFEPAFWSSVTGQDLLRGAKPPAHFSQVLSKAREFRESFSFIQPRAPTYAYFSLYWKTPEQAILGPNGNLPATGAWTLVAGDGRVPLPAGGARPDEASLSEYRPVNSVHGALPKDERFQQYFLKDRLPSLVATLIAFRLMTELGSDKTLLSAYDKAGGSVPVPEEFRAGMDAPLGLGGPARAHSALGREIVAAADSFRFQLCASSTICSGTYAKAKALGKTPESSARVFGNVLGADVVSPSERAAAVAQVGLANFKLGNTSAAGHVLSKASLDLAATIELSSTSAVGKFKLGELKVVVDRNLATALRDSGQCVAAKQLLTSLLDVTSDYRGDLKAKCYDRDTALYQALEEF
jgi:hypothetical protein